MKYFISLCLTAILLGALPAQAEDASMQDTPQPELVTVPGAIVTEKVAVSPEVNINAIPFMDFDLNKDGILSRDEVGEKLFRLFDRDGNEVIDNREMKMVGVMTFIPMEKETVRIVDYNAPGIDDDVTVTHQNFLEQSNLIKFDQDKDGLTPLDFIGKPFNQINIKKDSVIDLEEWKRAYASLVRPLHEEQFFYNN